MVKPDLYLTNLAISAANFIPFANINEGEPSNLVSMMEWEGIEIFGIKTETTPGGEPLLETEVYKVYVAKLPNGQTGLMKTNVNPESFFQVKAECEILRELNEISDRIDSLYGEDEKPFYGATFPKVFKSLEPEPDKFIMFLGYHPAIKSYRQLVPLPKILLGGEMRVDLKTVQWLFGKSLRFFDFLHRHCNISLNLIDESNLLIERDKHGVFWFDFSSFIRNPSPSQCKAEISELAKVMWRASGGTDEYEPDDDGRIIGPESDYLEYIGFLKRIMKGDCSDALSERDALYALADRIWPKEPNPMEEGKLKRQFHEFTTYPNVSLGDAYLKNKKQGRF